MNDREPPGYDDWFDEPEPPTLESGRGGRQPYDSPSETEEDVWTLPDDQPRRRPQRGGSVVVGGRSLTTTQIAILAIAGLAIIIAIVAALGGLGGSTPATTPSTPTTQPTLPTTATTPTTSTLTAPHQPLHEGDTGAQVKLLQQGLISLGYMQPPADGAFGPATKSAVESFQSANGLTPDCVVGQQTLTALKQALGG